MELSLAHSARAEWLGGNPLSRLSTGTLILVFLAASILAPCKKISAQISPSPKLLKLGAIPRLGTKLEQISTTNTGPQRTITKAIDKITRSLWVKGQPIFLDDLRILPPSKGEKVFWQEREAIDQLLNGIKWRHTQEESKAIFQSLIISLVEADRRITEHFIATAQGLVQVGEGIPRKVARAQREFATAKRQTNPLKAIREFKKAWETSQEVVEGRGKFGPKQ